MNVSYVKTIKDLIYLQYSKVLTKYQFDLPDDIEIQYQHYGFTKSTLRAFKYGKKNWEEIINEKIDGAEEHLKRCVYCGNNYDALKSESIIPVSTKIISGCIACVKKNNEHNNVIVCPECSNLKGNLGLYEFYKKKYEGDWYYYERIPKLIEKKYLSAIYYCHDCAGTLEKVDIDGDGKLTVMDIDFILH